jgi:hypothetical protein
MSNFWDIIWTAFLVFAFVAYLMILFSIITDLFRDRVLNGWYKALWFIFLIWVPYLAAFIYLIARGKGMAERQAEFAAHRREEAGAYIREVAGTGGPSAEIAQAKALLDAGTITEAEFKKLKTKALC